MANELALAKRNGTIAAVGRKKLPAEGRPMPRKLDKPVGFRHRETGYSPGGAHRNVYYWPGFRTKPMRTVPPLRTQAGIFGKTLDVFPTYYSGPEGQSPMDDDFHVEYPGTMVRVGEPPIEPHVHWANDIKRNAARVAPQITTQEVDPRALETEKMEDAFSANSIYLGDAVSSEAAITQAAQTVISEKASMGSEAAARVPWGEVFDTAIKNIGAAYAQKDAAGVNFVDKRLPAAEERAGLGISKGTLIALGIVAAGTWVIIKAAQKA